MKKIIFTIILCIVSEFVISQNYKVGKISKSELQEKVYPLDSSANAAFLYKKRNTYFEFVQNEGLQVITEIQERIKIYNHEGYKWATKEISYYNPSLNPERVTISNAKTYSLKDGKIESYKLKKKDVFGVNENKYWATKKFTMPNIKDGCVVEWKYRITSPYTSIDPVQLQHEIPIKKISCRIEIPEYYVYSIKETGYLPINIQKSQVNKTFEIANKARSGGAITHTNFSTSKINYNSNITLIENSNIPALLEESYVNNIDNYKSAIHYELASTQWPNQPFKNYTQSWEDVAKTISKNSKFGGELKKSSYFKDDLEKLRLKFPNKKELMLAIFEFVKHKVKWNNTFGKYSYNGVRATYKKGEGSVADINLMLVAMFKEAGIQANPIILSTRSHGIPIFPTLKGFNYVIAGVEVENDVLLFDATEENCIPNILPIRNLNWKGRIIRDNGSSTWVNLITQPAKSNIVVQVTINEDGEIEGVERAQYINYEAYYFRNKYGKVEDEDIIVKMEQENGNIEISDFKILNKKDLYKPATVMYKFNSDEQVDVVGNKIYFKPLLYMAETKNPFKLEKRDYPIDFGMPNDNKKVVSITIPKGYAVESIPESFAVGLPDNLGVYRFSIKQAGNTISVISSFKINTPFIPTEYYPQIKEFYKQMIAKNLEQIVLKKV